MRPLGGTRVCVRVCELACTVILALFAVCCRQPKRIAPCLMLYYTRLRSKMDVAVEGPSKRHIVADWADMDVARKPQHDGALTLEVRPDRRWCCCNSDLIFV